MRLKNYSEKMKEAHAFLGASKYSWLNYSEDRLIQVYKNHKAVLEGTKKHEFAAECIRMKQKLEKKKKTLNMYVNDAIFFGMSPEVILMYSDNCFGTADALFFDENEGFLRIHDLKTGSTPAKMEQLYIYDALFCLDYDIRPKDIQIENRIYQFNDKKIVTPSSDIILPIMDKIVRYDAIINNLKDQEE